LADGLDPLHYYIGDRHDPHSQKALPRRRTKGSAAQ